MQRIRTFSTFCRLLKNSSSSSSRWLQRQSGDFHTREAKLRNYASRAAFKLIELSKQHRSLLQPGFTIVDLGFAPGSWAQVAAERTKPDGKVIGVDILHCNPPPGVSAIQGNFLSPAVQNQLKDELNGEKVDTVLSDMCAAWPQVSGFWHRSINDPYIRLANTTGLAVRDHGQSIVSLY